MTFITTDYSENKQSQSTDFSPLPTGEYEVIINNAYERATQSGAESLSIDMIVRNDLDSALPETNGKYHNRHVFVDNWKRKATNQYDMKGLQYYLQAVKVPEGTEINSIYDFFKAIIGKPVLAYIKKEESTYKGETTVRNQVAPWSVQETKFPQVAHKGRENNDQFVGNNQPIEIDDSSLPF